MKDSISHSISFDRPIMISSLFYWNLPISLQITINLGTFLLKWLSFSGLSITGKTSANQRVQRCLLGMLVLTSVEMLTWHACFDPCCIQAPTPQTRMPKIQKRRNISSWNESAGKVKGRKTGLSQVERNGSQHFRSALFAADCQLPYLRSLFFEQKTVDWAEGVLLNLQSSGNASSAQTNERTVNVIYLAFVYTN